MKRFLLLLAYLLALSCATTAPRSDNFSYSSADPLDDDTVITENGYEESDEVPAGEQTEDEAEYSEE